MSMLPAPPAGSPPTRSICTTQKPKSSQAGTCRKIPKNQNTKSMCTTECERFCVIDVTKKRPRTHAQARVRKPVQLCQPFDECGHLVAETLDVDQFLSRLFAQQLPSEGGGRAMSGGIGIVESPHMSLAPTNPQQQGTPRKRNMKATFSRKGLLVLICLWEGCVGRGRKRETDAKSSSGRQSITPSVPITSKIVSKSHCVATFGTPSVGWVSSPVTKCKHNHSNTMCTAVAGLNACDLQGAQMEHVWIECTSRSR
jgi:hypothetical protein